MNTFKKTGGFTLVELIIVIAILAILSSVAVAGYSTYIKNANDSAVNTELSNISSAAVLANAAAGNIAKIEVENDDGTLKITVTAAASGFAKDFDADFTSVCGAAAATATDEDELTREYTLTAQANWAGSKSFTDNKAEWASNEWE